MKAVDVIRGDGPVVLGMPHTGTHVPDSIRAQLNANGRLLADTDWHIDRLYAGLLSGATTVRANFHRYVIDANRDPEGRSLYPGQNTTGLVPASDFDGMDIWAVSPSAQEIDDRRATWHAPYHAALRAELDRVRALHGVAVLYDCHSIRSHIPYLFEGALPDFNIGTADGSACAPALERAVQDIAGQAGALSSVLNGRFKGGWTTRHYGRPEQGIHAIQMELTQSAYLAAEAAPWTYDTAKANAVRPRLAQILKALADLTANMGDVK